VGIEDKPRQSAHGPRTDLEPVSVGVWLLLLVLLLSLLLLVRVQ
jgi:hypothetical protein